MPGLAADERLRIRVRTVKWLKSIDEPTLRRDWLPDEHRDQPTESDLRAFLSLVANVQSAEENNLVGDASKTADPAGSLKWVMAELPGSAAAAQRRLDELAK